LRQYSLDKKLQSQIVIGEKLQITLTNEKLLVKLMLTKLMDSNSIFSFEQLKLTYDTPKK